MTEAGWHWRTSVAINRALGGRAGQPLCSRAWQNGWACFIECMAILWRDPVHCESVHLRWLAMQAYAPPPVTGRTGPDASY